MIDTNEPPRGVVLNLAAAVCRRRSPKYARLTAPHVGDAAFLHLHASQIANTLRDLTSIAPGPGSLVLGAVEVERQSVAIDAFGTPAALDHWLTDDRLFAAVQAAIDQAGRPTSTPRGPSRPA